jgi:hypothetical protein
MSSFGESRRHSAQKFQFFPTRLASTNFAVVPQHECNDPRKFGGVFMHPNIAQTFHGE